MCDRCGDEIDPKTTYNQVCVSEWCVHTGSHFCKNCQTTHLDPNIKICTDCLPLIAILRTTEFQHYRQPLNRLTAQQLILLPDRSTKPTHHCCFDVTEMQKDSPLHELQVHHGDICDEGMTLFCYQLSLRYEYPVAGASRLVDHIKLYDCRAGTYDKPQVHPNQQPYNLSAFRQEHAKVNIKRLYWTPHTHPFDYSRSNSSVDAYVRSDGNNFLHGHFSNKNSTASIMIHIYNKLPDLPNDESTEHGMAKETNYDRIDKKTILKLAQQHIRRLKDNGTL